ncbi:MAG: thioredoxin [Saprospirales bacterium]|nr:MAG: thioredoxin [Saprospirales bacterium]
MKTTSKKASLTDLINSDTPVLIDLFATWCGPCKMMDPVLKEVARKNTGNLQVVKIDVDKNPAAAQSLKVRGVPTLILFKNGKQLWRQSGYMSAAQLQATINANLN